MNTGEDPSFNINQHFNQRRQLIERFQSIHDQIEKLSKHPHADIDFLLKQTQELLRQMAEFKEDTDDVIRGARGKKPLPTQEELESELGDMLQEFGTDPSSLALPKKKELVQGILAAFKRRLSQFIDEEN